MNNHGEDEIGAVHLNRSFTALACLVGRRGMRYKREAMKPVSELDSRVACT
jgi:hypothetical protein